MAVPPEETFDGTWPFEAHYTDAPGFRMHYVEENPALAEQFSIHSIPSLLFFEDGKEVDRVTGVVSKEVLAEKLNTLVRKDIVVS